MNQTIGKLLALNFFRIAVPIKELIVGLKTVSVENDGLKYLVESSPSPLFRTVHARALCVCVRPGFLSLEQSMQD